MKILIIGGGFVGKATGFGLNQKGHHVTFVDINDNVIQSLNNNGYEAYKPEEVIRRDYDYIFICLPTPYNEYTRKQDMGIVMSSTTLLSKLLEDNKPLIALRSTVLPGTSRSMVNELEKLTNKKEGKDFYFCINPEFLRARSALDDLIHG